MEKLAIVRAHTFEVDERATIAAHRQSLVRIERLTAIGAMRPLDGSEWSGHGFGIPSRRGWLWMRPLAVMGIGAIRVNRNIAIPAQVDGLLGIDRAAALRANRFRWRLRRWVQGCDPPILGLDSSLARNWRVHEGLSRWVLA